MAGWENLLPRAPAPQSAASVYENAIKTQQLRQEGRQRQQYNDARIGEQNALAAQHTRVTAVKNGLAKAYADNTKAGEDGSSAVNWVGVTKQMQDMGYGDETPDILKEAAAAHKSDLEGLESRTKYVAGKLGGIQRLNGDDWKDPNKRALSRDQSLTAIDELEREGILDPQTAAAQRAAASNYDPKFQGFLDSHSQQNTALGNQLLNAKRSVDAYVEQMSAPSKIDKAQADAVKAGAEATEKSNELGGRMMEAGVVPDTSNTGTPPLPAGAPVKTTQPPDTGSQYNTQLKPEEQAAFQAWKQKYAPNDSGDDYDLQGAFKAGVTPDADRGHFPDTFKKPNHPTFSDESQYSGKNGNVGGHWNENGTFTPGATNLRTHGVTGLQQYFDKNEPDTKLDIGKKDPNWTPEKQADWDAKRADPAFAGVKQYMSPVWTKKQEDSIAKLGPKQAAARGGDPSTAELNRMKLIGAKGGLAADKGPGEYTRFYDSQSPEDQKLLQDPDKYDPKETPRQVRMLGETAAQQLSPNKPGGTKPPTPGQLNTIESQKNSAIGKAKNDFRKATASVIGKAKTDQHLAELRETTQNIQNEYENKLRQFGLEVGHFEYPPASEWERGGFPQNGNAPKAATTPSVLSSPKIGTLDQVKRFAEKHNLSVEAARKIVEDQGYIVK